MVRPIILFIVYHPDEVAIDDWVKIKPRQNGNFCAVIWVSASPMPSPSFIFCNLMNDDITQFCAACEVRHN